MAKAEKRVKITLECTECKHRNYITMKNKLNDRERIEMKKYCRHDRHHLTGSTNRKPDPVRVQPTHHPVRCREPEGTSTREYHCVHALDEIVRSQ